MTTLKEHIDAINAKTQAWLDANPGSWGGMLTTDMNHWADMGVTTVDEFIRWDLETQVYECHKDAYGVKGRHYDFASMSIEELEAELDHLIQVANQVAEAEAEAEEAALRHFEAQVAKNIEYGAKDRATAIRWILAAEELDKEYDMGYICYTLGLNYKHENMFREVL